MAWGHRVKVNEAYRGRATLLNNISSPDDLSLWLRDLRSNDSGHYYCKVQKGLEDASDLIQLQVKGNTIQNVHHHIWKRFNGSLMAARFNAVMKVESIYACSKI